jgi:hypothetical protein
VSAKGLREGVGGGSRLISKRYSTSGPLGYSQHYVCTIDVKPESVAFDETFRYKSSMWYG